MTDEPIQPLFGGTLAVNRADSLDHNFFFRRRRRLAALVVAIIATVCPLIAVVFLGAHRRSAAARAVQGDVPFRLYGGTLAMPTSAAQYDGNEDERDVQVRNDLSGVAHVFVIGDWGATSPGHMTYGCNETDCDAQLFVADQFKARARTYDPQYVLNVGDNFYVAGLEHSCNAPPNDNMGATTIAFTAAWHSIYGDMANKPWLSVLGNHDYGGWMFSRGWPQQIGYSFVNHNWIMPARYYSKRVWHPTFAIDYFMLDSNAYDAKLPGEYPAHNLCSSKHNAEHVQTCANNGGMTSVEGCRKWFLDSWGVQKAWAERKLAKSDARWKIVVTHFPCGFDTDWYKSLKAKHGLDLIVTGHRHQQELWKPDTTSSYMRSFLGVTGWDDQAPACIVSGGGGGIASQNFPDADYGTDITEYGFFHLTISFDELHIALIDGREGQVSGTYTIYPSGSQEASAHPAPQVGSDTPGLCANFCGDANHVWDAVCPGGPKALQCCEGCFTCRRRAGSP